MHSFYSDFCILVAVIRTPRFDGGKFEYEVTTIIICALAIGTNLSTG